MMLEAVRPAGIDLVHLVVDGVHGYRHGQLELACHVLGDLLPFFQALGVCDLELVVGDGLAVGGMSLADVDNVDVGLVLVRLVQLFDGAD